MSDLDSIAINSSAVVSIIRGTTAVDTPGACSGSSRGRGGRQAVPWKTVKRRAPNWKRTHI